MFDLFKRKPLDLLMTEASETGEHCLRRALGPINLITLGIGAIIGAGIFVLTGIGRGQVCRSRHRPLLRSGGHRLHFRRPLLRRVCLAHPDRRLGLHLRLRHAGRALRLDHRLGPDPGVCFWRRHRGLRLERLRAQLPAGLRHSHSAATHAGARRRPGRSTTAIGSTLRA